MKTVCVLLVTCLCALGAPWLAHTPSLEPVAAESKPRWPAHFQGRPLTEVAIGGPERVFLHGFPGSMARFTDGERDIVLRWVTRATRQLHPATDCYRALGYKVSDARIVTDEDHTQWRCFAARRDGDAKQVCEQLQDRDGRRWTDVSAWYWSAALNQSEGPWLVTTVAR